MKRAWRTLALAAFTFATPSALAEEKLVPVPEGQPVAGAAGAYGQADCPACAAREAAASGAGFAGTPAVVGDYRVGHIHESAFGHITGRSLYHPYIDNIHQPFRQVAYGGAHARYYAGYRNVYAPNWHEYYVPRYYAPAAYGYDPYGPSYYGYGQTRSSFYGPDIYGSPASPPATPVPPSPPTVYRRSGFDYTGDPGLYSPFGAGSSSYFGAYGSAGY